MTLLFVYGSLRQGCANAHVTRSRPLPGRWCSRERLPMYLLGSGRVPCLVLAPGTGMQVVGELYEVGPQAPAAIDRLERLGEPDGYEHVPLECERFDITPPLRLTACAYAKPAARLSADVPRIGPLAEYRAEHAAGFRC